jgi:hypothetical protein
VASRHGGEGGYEQPSKQSFVVYLIAKKFVWLLFMGFEKTLPAKCSVLLFRFRAEHNQSLETAVTNIG